MQLTKVDLIHKRTNEENAAAGAAHAQLRKDGSVEPPLVTVGDDLNTAAEFLKDGRESYSAADVVKSLLRKLQPVAEELEPMLAMMEVEPILVATA